jgi:sec-independent protein translocase protein TatB
MFDFGLSYSHILVIVIIAVVVIGPKDLPIVLRKVGQFMQKARGMAREFQGHVDVAMRDAGMADIKKDLQTLKSGIDTPINVPPVIKPSVPPSSWPSTTPENDFKNYFGSENPTGETRVAGRGLEQAP